MSLLNKLFNKTEEKKSAKIAKALLKIKETTKPAVISGAEKAKVQNNQADLKMGKIILSLVSAEKALSARRLNQYVFKVAPKANKIEIAKVIGKNYNVKAIAVNIINIPKKARLVGKIKGFKSGYKKAIVTLAKGQSIEIK